MSDANETNETVSGGAAEPAAEAGKSVPVVVEEAPVPAAVDEAADEPDDKADMVAELKAWVRRELHLHAVGHTEDERREANP